MTRIKMFNRALPFICLMCCRRQSATWLSDPLSFVTVFIHTAFSPVPYLRPSWAAYLFTSVDLFKCSPDSNVSPLNCSFPYVFMGTRWLKKKKLKSSHCKDSRGRGNKFTKHRTYAIQNSILGKEICHLSTWSITGKNHLELKCSTRQDLLYT